MILRKRLKAIFAFFAAACFLCVCLSCAAILQAGAAETDYAETGIDLLTSPPTAETVYKAGAGTVTYKPAADGAAQIVLQDAELYAGTKVTYSPGNWTYTALAAQGDVELVLQGESTIYLAPSYSNTGLLFYDSNLTVQGEGSVWVGFEDASAKNFNAFPMDVMERSGAETDESGNFRLESGTLSLNAAGAIGRGCLTVNHKIEICGGELKTNGQMAGVYSTYGDIEITGGKCPASGSPAGIGETVSRIPTRRGTAMSIYGAERFPSKSFGSAFLRSVRLTAQAADLKCRAANWM